MMAALHICTETVHKYSQSGKPYKPYKKHNPERHTYIIELM